MRKLKGETPLDTLKAWVHWASLNPIDEWNANVEAAKATQVAHPVCPKCSTPMELGMCDLWFCPVSGCTASNGEKV